MRIGAKLPNSGKAALEIGIPAMARTLEAAGFDSLWVSDHIVLPRTIVSRYPFAADGVATWATDTPYLDALIALALAAAVTERVRLGTAVLVLPLRAPVVFAKQVATIDRASGGRLELGLGAGWLAEEFDALDVPFAQRGKRLEEWIELARACWTGRPPAHRSERYTLPPEVLSYPTPAHEIPLLIGGHSPTALRRAAQIGDGWLAQQSAGEFDVDEIAAAVQAMRDAGAANPRVTLRIVDSLTRSESVADALPKLARAGVGEVIVDAPVDDDRAAEDHLQRLRGQVA